MDLIYTDENNVELGILEGYELDTAFGSSENDFELKLSLDQNVLQIGSQFYIEGTEYGGIVDAVAIDTENNEITYSGRTWHGILAGKIVTRIGAEFTVTLSGEANALIQKLIEMCDLSDTFVCLEGESDFYIDNFTVYYQDLYSVLTEMLAGVNARLNIYRIGRQVCLAAVPLINYANSEEWDAAEKSFKAEHKGNKTNHLICLGGYDEREERIIIDLFTDENGTVMEYSSIEEPYDSSHYITDGRNQQLFGKDEITEVYEMSSSGITNNYILLEECPADFGSEFDKYFKLEDDKYTNLQIEEREVLIPLVIKPKDWDNVYMNYFNADGSTIENGGMIEEYFEPLPKGPVPTVSDWKKNFSKYYYLKTDGLEIPTWTQVEGIDVKKYVEQSMMPSNWSSEWGNAFIYWFKMESVKKEKYKDKDGKERQRTVPFEKNKFYKKEQDATVYILLKTKPSNWEEESTKYYVATGSEYVRADTKYSARPKWKKGTFFNYVTVKKKAPVWDELNQYGIRHPAHMQGPDFEPYWFARKGKELFKPEWIAGEYYELHKDKYAKLVEGGLKKLMGYQNNDSIDITLPVDGYEYFVGDIVGASDDEHNFSVVQQPITKKIVKIDYTGIEISYEIGGK